MQLRELLSKVGEIYLAQAKPNQMATEVQKLLREDAGPLVEQYLPGGYTSEGSGGKGTPAKVPWIAVFDPNETDTATRGMYLAYLFAADMKTVSLSLMNGVTELRKEMGGAKARAAMQGEAHVLREAIKELTPLDATTTIDLKSKAERPMDYQWGNIIALTYSLEDLPDTESLASDLHRFVVLYDLALTARNEGHKQSNPAIVTRPPAVKQPKPPREPEFKPKNDADYMRIINARAFLVERKHETLVKQYGEFLIERKFSVSTETHPRDMIAERNHEHWLIEAKVIRGNSYEQAARDAMAQLIFYRRFLYPSTETVKQLALFNEDPGATYTEFFDELGMAAVWKEGADWQGTTTAQSHGLC